jgi:hypothetical protein
MAEIVSKNATVLSLDCMVCLNWWHSVRVRGAPERVQSIYFYRSCKEVADEKICIPPENRLSAIFKAPEGAIMSPWLASSCRNEVEVPLGAILPKDISNGPKKDT